MRRTLVLQENVMHVDKISFKEVLTEFFRQFRQTPYGNEGKVVWVVECPHNIYGESCVCKCVGHKVQLAGYDQMIGRYRIKGYFKKIGGSYGRYVIAEDQTPRPSLLSRFFLFGNLKRWDKFASSEEKNKIENEFAQIRKEEKWARLQRAYARNPDPGRTYSFTGFTELDYCRASIQGYKEDPLPSPFAQ